MKINVTNVTHGDAGQFMGLDIEIQTSTSTTKLEFREDEDSVGMIDSEFHDINLIKDALVEAYEAGKRGEPIVLEYEYQEED